MSAIVVKIIKFKSVACENCSDMYMVKQMNYQYIFFFFVLTNEYLLYLTYFLKFNRVDWISFFLTRVRYDQNKNNIKILMIQSYHWHP